MPTRAAARPSATSTPPFAEQKIVHGGKQSMPLDYNNVKSPFYSEAEREFAPAQDWTADGVDTLVLYVRGQRINKAAPLYRRRRGRVEALEPRSYIPTRRRRPRAGGSSGRFR